jgi:Arc/MetJ family transcription regulator
VSYIHHSKKRDLVAKTLIDVDEYLLERARAILGPGATKKDAVNTAVQAPAA